MSYYIYGFRLRGELECRYIGMTGQSPDKRLSGLTNEAGAYHRRDRNHPDGLHQWLLDNKGSIEAFKIAKCDYAEQARSTEAVVISLVLRLGHRLLNVTHVPEDLRIGYVPTLCMQARRDRAARRRRIAA